MRNRLNFAGIPFRNQRLPSLLYGLLAFSLLAVTILHGVVLTRSLLKEQEELDVKVEVLEKELSELGENLARAADELKSERNEARTERIRFLTAVYRQKGFSWTGLFNELETITPPTVRITSIAPSVEKAEILVRLTILGKTLNDVLEMVRQLEANRIFGKVLPLSESQAGEREGGGIATTLTLQYRPEMAEPPPKASDKGGEAEEAPSDAEIEVEGEPEQETPEVESVKVKGQRL